MAGKEVNFDIVAKDKASKVLDGVADKAEKVEKSDPTVDVDADARKATHTLDGFADQLDRLTDTDKAVVVALRAGAATAELRDLAGDLARIDAADPELDVKFARYAEVSGQLDQLETQLRDLAGAGAALDKVAGRLDDVGAAADRTGGAVHSMAGNAVGDFAATATGVGPLGEALGQLTEMAAGGEAGLKGLATAGLGLGAISAGMLVVNKVMGEFEKTAKRAAEIKAFNTADVDAYIKSLQKGTLIVDDYVRKIKEAGRLDVVAGIRTSLGAVGFGQIRDITDQLAAAGITVEQFAQAATGSGEELARFVAAVEQLGMSTHDADLIITAATNEHANYAAAVERSTKFSGLFADSQKAINAEAARWTGQAKAYAASLDDAGDAQKNLDAAARRVNSALDRQSRALDELRGNISDQQAWVDLAGAFDTVRDSATALDDVKKKHEDATDAARTHMSNTLALRQSIIDYGTEVLGLPVEHVTTIITNVQDDDLDTLERRLERIKQNAEITASIILRGGAGYDGGVSGPRSAPVPSLATAAAPARWARINGR